ncbi:proprotein convertase P-domain-containing protein, partial [bacterium AH-315-M05]|nr:proprotein convertase P-domain-containing protein [bacterium AH-315-M05]
MCCFALLLLGYNFSAFAGHRPGGVFSWECIGPNTYVIKFTRITNCNNNLDDDYKYCITGSLPGDPNNANDVVVDSAYSIPHPVTFCDGIQTCGGGGSYNWPYEVVYLDTIVLTPFSPSYTISYCDGGGRPNADNGSGGFQIQATFDTIAPCNSAAVPTTFHDVYYCYGDTGCIINNYSDPDGDSLVFYLGDCYNFNYNGGFSGTNPMTSTIAWSVDSVGNICFLPPAIQTGYICLFVEEWRGGVKIAENVNEVLIRVIDCSLLSDPVFHNTTTSFDVDLTGNPDTAWVSLDTTRSGSVCGVTCGADCIEFMVTFDSATVGVIFDISSGAVPPGTLSYQVDCSTTTLLGEFVCLPDGVGPHRITFCADVGTTNEYIINALTGPSLSDNNLTINQSCTGEIATSGYETSTVSFTTIYPGAIGAYNSYLSCTFGCDTTQVTPDSLPPSFIDVQVCGELGGACDSLLVICDTFRIAFIDTILCVNIQPNDAAVCFGDTSTILTAYGTGGAPPYTYLWNTGDTSQSITIGPGIYTVVLSDATSLVSCDSVFDNCRIGSAIVNGLGAPVTVSAGNDTSICLGDTVQLNGTVQVVPGSYPLSAYNTTDFPIPNDDHDGNNYSATHGVQSTIDISGSCYNSITSGMIQSVCISIDYPKAKDIDIFLVCPDGTWIELSTDNGGGDPAYSNTCFTPTASTNITAAAPPFTGDFLPEDSFDNLNGCPINGTWTLNVQDDKGGPVGTLLGWSITFTNDSCLDVNYAWSPAGTISDSTIINPFAIPDSTTDYIFNIYDDAGCISTSDTMRVTVNPPINLSLSPINISCFADNNGVATVVVSGGVSPYTYLWDDPLTQTNASATGLGPGTYTVTVTDNSDCAATDSVTITEPSVITINITDSVDVNCNGGNNGSATVSASGGTPSYTYLWSSGGQTSPIATGLSAGAYTVTVTDTNACTTTASVTITEPTLLGAAITGSTNVSCNGANDGDATVFASGGVPPYTYFWNTTPSQSTATATGLGPGTYNATVTDDNGCDTTVSVTITEPPLLSASITSIINVSCNGAEDGELTVTETGGTPSYAYLWDDPLAQTASTATNLDTGTYTVLITDANGCTTSASATISQPSVLGADITASTNVSCFGGNDGTATVSASGGTPLHTYLWVPGGQTTTTATGLSAGAYTVTVTDANGCDSVVSVTITQPAELLAFITGSIDVSCNGGSDGEATMTAIGGTPPGTYTWNTSPVQFGTIATGLSAGTYYGIITDGNGCADSASVTINEPDLLSLSITEFPASCGQPTGEACVTVSGGVSPYTYFWNTSPVQNSACATGLLTGSYDITVVDDNDCAVTATAFISDLDVILTLNSVTDVTCYGGSDGDASVTASGGTSPYTYSWSDGQTTSTATGLAAGSHTVTATDANGCSASLTITVNEPLPIVSSISTIGVSCNGGSDGTATVTPSGVSPPYDYLWSNGQTTATATGLSATSYTVLVTDALGCDTTVNISITEPPPLVATISGVINVSCNGGSDGVATVTGSGGFPGYTYSWNTTPVQTTGTATGLAPIAYTATVVDANGCSTSTTITITEPTALTASIIGSTNISCNGLCDGDATVAPAGGTPAYTYIWNTTPVQSAPTATGLCPGTYTATVVDANGCDTSVNITITEPTLLTGSITSVNNVSCNGGSDGDATATPSGGTAPYTYLWDDPLTQTDSIADSLSVGTYNVSITDANGCNISLSVTITEPTLLTASITSSTNVSCNGAGDGEATVTAAGGTPAYTYLWDDGSSQTTATATGLIPATYTVLVTDVN